MRDFYLLLTPILVLMIVSLVGFVGCNWFFELEETVPYPPPAPPTGLTAAPRDSAVDLSWDAYTGADKLTIKMGTIQGSHPSGHEVLVTDTTYPWPGLVNGQTYWFAMTATSMGFESAESNEVSAIPGLYGVVLPFLDQTQLGSMRQFDGWMGMRITTGPGNLTLRALGRWFDAAATGSHAMRIAAAANPMVPLASVTVVKSAPNTRSEFVYENLTSTIPLAANTDYYVVSEESAAAEPFHDSDLTRVSILDANAGADARAAFGDGAGNYTVAPTTGAAYGPVNLLYTRP